MKSRTLANLSKLPDPIIELIRRALKGERFSSLDDTFEIVGSLHHGHVAAVLTTIRNLRLPELLASRSSRMRRLVVALIASRILYPASKLATARSWNTSTLPAELDISGADENELYAAMDWLDGRQEAIEEKLAERHLENGG
ncbi:MAG: transposase, partial [Planctomycetota bacterium]